MVPRSGEAYPPMPIRSIPRVFRLGPVRNRIVPAVMLIAVLLGGDPVAPTPSAAVAGPAGAPPGGAQQAGRVRAGVDELQASGFEILLGRRVATLTHLPSRDGRGIRTIDLLQQAEGVELVRLFTPEHGIASSLEGKVDDGRDGPTGLPVISLYGDRRRPRPVDLEGLDDVVVDLQGAGVRFYTYATTLAYMLEACADAGVRVVVLDRPNPLGGSLVEGPSADENLLSFLAYAPIPVVHGMTMGELALYFQAAGTPAAAAELQVVALGGWRRWMRFEDTGLVWRAPSPNLRNPTQALLYPAVGLLEACELSVGRGTDEPFERIGAPWIRPAELAAALEAAEIPGLRFTGIEFTPLAATYAGERCGGVQLRLSDPGELRPVAAGMRIARVLEALYARAFDAEAVDERLMAPKAWAAWAAGTEFAPVDEAFLMLLGSVLLYPTD